MKERLYFGPLGCEVIIRVSIDQDLQLVQRTLQGDLSAFDELVKKYQGPIYMLCLSFTAQREDAKDLAQEVFLKAFENLKRFRRDAQFRTWIYRIAINRCLNFNKTQRREFVELREAFGALTYSFTNDFEQAENRRRVQLLSAQLPNKQRTAIVLRLEQGLSYEEISHVTGQTVANVKTTLFYALRKIKKLVQKSRGAGLRYLKHLESD